MIRVPRVPFALVCALAIAACTEQVGPSDSTLEPNFAKGGGKPSGEPSVTAVTPPYGHQGEVALDVTIDGSGFEPGAEATWERGGVVEAKITVHATRFVSATQVVANISIASDAEIAFYDVAVTNPSRKKGISTESFEVTQATSIGTLGGNTLARGVNDAVEITGYSVVGTQTHALYWSAGTGIVDLGVGQGYEIDEAGTTIVGSAAGHAAVWTTNGPAGWSAAQALPRSVTSSESHAFAIATRADGSLVIGGDEAEKAAKGNGQLPRPTIWQRAPAGDWIKTRLALPQGLADEYAWVTDVSPGGLAAGVSRAGSGPTHAVVWELDGTPRFLGPAGSGIQGINTAGTVAVGAYNGTAAYYKYENGAWTGPLLLSGSCERAMAVADNGNIVGSRCTSGAGNRRFRPAVWIAPDYTTMITLGSLGDATGTAAVESISRNGAYIVGAANGLGAYWYGF